MTERLVTYRSSYQEYLARTYFGNDAFDRSEFDRMEKLLENVTLFIDVGASHGVYTYHANRFLKGATIIAIEADPERFQILVENVRSWRSGSSNEIQCINAAASDEVDRQQSAFATFYKTGTQISGGLFSVSERTDRYDRIEVPLICVDDYFDATAVTLVKVDVEGAELRVLKGASRHIFSGNTRFFTEISWWGDRERGTGPLDVLHFCLKSKLRIDRRLRSDYLISPDPRWMSRILSVGRCLPPLLLRTSYDFFVPLRIRTWRERRENRRRISRFNDA